MQVYRFLNSYDSFQKDFGKQSKKDEKGKKLALTIGNFESVHLGHMKLIESLPKQYQKALISFEPSPNAYFLKTSERIYSLKQKI